MDILHKPDALSLTGSMDHLVLSAADDISFVLKYADSGQTIVQHVYTPSKTGRIEVDLERIITPLLSFRLQDRQEPYRQTDIARRFRIEIKEKKTNAAASYAFTALRAGIDRLADTADAWLKGNFLTWQPTVKPVTYYTPEFLTYYAVEDSVVKCKAYTEQDGGHAEDILTLASLGKDTVWTVPLQYAVIAGKTGKLPSYYDVWVEDTAGTRLTYVQRYYASGIRSEQEQWVLFENSLGGIDTFRAYGDSENTAKHTHNIAEIGDDAEEYRVDTVREYKKNTGHLSLEERKWLLDFFPSLGKFLYAGNHIRRIVVIDSDATWKTSELPSAYSFTYRYADARPYLNITRPEGAALRTLDIKIPDIGSFTVAPRLAELERLPLSGGALFPVQSPYSDHWNITSAAALLAWFASEVKANYGDDGAFGHRHDNMSVLQALNRIGDYLTLDAQKISAGLADVAVSAQSLAPESTDWDKIVRTDKDTLVRAVITFLKGIYVAGGRGIDKDGTANLLDLFSRYVTAESLKSRDFRTGLTDGSGFGIYEDEHGKSVAEVDKLEVRQKATFAELEYRRMAFTTGDVGYTSAGGRIAFVKKTGYVFRCYFLADDGEKRVANEWRVGDMAMCRTANLLSRTTKQAADRYYWRLVVNTGEETTGGKLYYFIDLSDIRGSLELTIDGKKHVCVGMDTSTENDVPQAEDDIIQLGSQTDPDRQYAYVIYVSEGKRVDYAGINDYDLTRHIVNEFSPRGTTIRSDSFKVISGAGTGTSSPLVCERGAWYDGAVSGHYDHWSHNNATWLCIVGKGMTTTAEPKDGSPEWLKETYGQKGDPGGTGYRVEAFASPGSSAYSELQTDWKATYAIHVWYNEREITCELPSTRFVWSRVSEYTEGDAAWNERHAGTGNELSVTYDDLNGDTSFICRFLDRDGMKTINTTII